jgi:hypothetical protein
MAKSVEMKGHPNRLPSMAGSMSARKPPAEPIELPDGMWQRIAQKASPGLFMNTYYSGRSSRPAGLFSFGLLDGPQVRLRRPHLREAPAALRSQPLRDGFMNNPAYDLYEQCRMREGYALNDWWEAEAIVMDEIHESRE